jgi:hypothetical protein
MTIPNKIAISPHSDCAHQERFQRGLSWLQVPRRSSPEMCILSEQSHVCQKSNSDWRISMQNIPPVLSMCFSIVYTWEKIALWPKSSLCLTA